MVASERTETMTAKKAKEITLVTWSYYRDHPEVHQKEDAPEEIQILTEELFRRCALCEVFGEIYCAGCQIDDPGMDTCEMYFAWLQAKTDEERSAAADAIVQAVTAWDIGDAE